MKKTIIVIGGGISGLSTLHYLKKKYQGQAEIDILLLERNDDLGGVIHTQVDVGARFETGANGFLNNSPMTFELIKELGIENQLIESSEDNKIRYLCVGQKLYALPMSPMNLINFPLLKWNDKWALMKERSVKRGADNTETVYEFVKRRLSQRWAELFADSVISGIYAGDAKAIILKDAFPQLFEYEKEYGSVLKGLMASRKKGAPKRKLFSMKDGMGVIIQALKQKHEMNIRTKQEVENIQREGEQQYVITTSDQMYTADQVFMTLPAYRAANLVRSLDANLAGYLNEINYAPLAVVGFVCSKSDFVNIPAGFGYLKPSGEKGPVIGVLFESQIYENRAQSDQCMIRLMIGGMHNLEILKCSKEDLISVARKEIIQTLGFKGEPYHIFLQAWSNAIPQYDRTLNRVTPLIDASLDQFKNLFISGNYRGGVSTNDCIKSSHQVVENSSL